MTVSSGFFNSVNHDRLYDAEQFSSIFDGVITDGVYLNYGDALRVTAVPNQNSCVVVGIGRAWFDHTWTFNDAPLSFTMDPPNEMITRVDAIVIDVDRRKDVRANSIIYVKGSGATPGEPPVLLKEELHRQYPICYIRRTPGSNAPVKQSEIEYLVGTDDCPAVTTVLETLNLENLWLQLDSEFNIWWDGIRDLIDDDHPVLDLQNQIDELRKKLEATPTGLLERYILDMFKTGDFGLNVKTFQFTGGETMEKPYKFSEPTPGYVRPNTTYAPNTQMEGITPDGGFVNIYFPEDSGVNSNIYSRVSVSRRTSDGVNTDNNLDNMIITCARGSRSYIYTNTDTYPSTFCIAFYGRKSRTWGDDDSVSAGKTKIYITVLSITISSDDVLQYSKTCEYVSDEVTDTSWSYLGGPSLCKKTTAGNTIIWACYGTNSIGASGDRDYGLYTANNNWLARVSSDGAVSNIHRSTSGPIYITEDYQGLVENNGSGKYTYYIDYDHDLACETSYGMAGKAIEYVADDYWVEIDETTLETTRHIKDGNKYSSTGYEYPEWETTKYLVQTFDLSEANGVSVSKKEAGSKVSDGFTSEHVADYFLGASNAGGGLPEGTFLAIEDSGRYYGLTSSGEQLAIGADGGAAVLKAKASSVPSIDKEKVLSVAKGYLNTSKGVVYVIANNGLYDTTKYPARTYIGLERE